MADKPITINQDYSLSPSQTDIGFDDTVTFNVTRDCCISFTPNHCFGRRLKLTVGTHGPYAPSVHTNPPKQVQVNTSISDINSTCAPPPIHPTSYSIKVG